MRSWKAAKCWMKSLPLSAGDKPPGLQDATTRIYEACSFQDITGQRITKVVATLKTIERKVAHIIGTFGTGIAQAVEQSVDHV